MKKQYIKHNFKYWTAKKLNKHSMRIWISIITLMALFTLWAYINRQVNKNPLISPLVSITVPQARASESISCEDPRGYLLCKVYSHEITWDQYETLNKIFECESHYNPNALGTNTHKDGSISVDRGIGQVNNRYHKALSNEDAFNFKKNIDYSVNLFKRSGGNQWSCYKLNH